MQNDSQSSDCLSSAAKDVSIHLLCFGQAFFFCFPTFSEMLCNVCHRSFAKRLSSTISG